VILRWGKEITGSDEAAPLAGYLGPRVANDGTDLQKVGFVFLKEVTPVELKVVR
jgi:hypothetical protein